MTAVAVSFGVENELYEFNFFFKPSSIGIGTFYYEKCGYEEYCYEVFLSS